MSRVEAFETCPWGNYIHEMPVDRKAWGRLLAEHANFHHQSNFLPLEGSVDTAKRVLGKQDYTVNLSYRNWVWERPVSVTLSDGTTQVYRWRLFASQRGLSFEIEVGPHSKEVALAVWQTFQEMWQRQVRTVPVVGLWKGEPVQVIQRTSRFESRGSSWDVIRYSPDAKVEQALNHDMKWDRNDER